MVVADGRAGVRFHPNTVHAFKTSGKAWSKSKKFLHNSNDLTD